MYPITLGPRYFKVQVEYAELVGAKGHHTISTDLEDLIALIIKFSVFCQFLLSFRS